jgi:hypothetical protein
MNMMGQVEPDGGGKSMARASALSARILFVPTSSVLSPFWPSALLCGELVTCNCSSGEPVAR